MIHIATVHFKSDRWIAIQRDYFRRYLRSPYRVYGWLNDVPNHPADAFDYVCTEPVLEHAIKLNLLGDMICFAARSDDDVIMFIDGDAFPVGDVEGLIADKLEQHRLIAVQRLENNGDSQPHPCFCVTTVGFWRRIKGDWKEGFQWQAEGGKSVTDVGGNLLKQMRDHRVDWLPLLRSGGATAHPVLFSIYADRIYHHGAGFRDVVTRFDVAQEKPTLADWVAGVFPWRVKRVARRRIHKRIGRQNAGISEQVFRQIQSDPEFFEKRIRLPAARSVAAA